MAAKRRATALLVFCTHALRRLSTSALTHSEKERATSQELLTLLLTVSTAKPDDAAYREVAVTARTVMTCTLDVMSASDFVVGILTMLESGSAHVSPLSHMSFVPASDLSLYRHKRVPSIFSISDCRRW